MEERDHAHRRKGRFLQFPRTMEQLVLDWVHDSKRGEAYLFFYGIVAEFFFHKLNNIPFGGRIIGLDDISDVLLISNYHHH